VGSEERLLYGRWKSRAILENFTESRRGMKVVGMKREPLERNGEIVLDDSKGPSRQKRKRGFSGRLGSERFF
jgi:hypothetical protein